MLVTANAYQTSDLERARADFSLWLCGCRKPELCLPEWLRAFPRPSTHHATVGGTAGPIIDRHYARPFSGRIKARALIDASGLFDLREFVDQIADCFEGACGQAIEFHQ